MILAMTLVLFACKRADVKAATDNGVSVNVPSKMDIIFNEDGDLRNWNTANVTSMNNMFYNAGKNASWSLNCRNWNVKNVKYNLNFNTGVESKVTEPVWVN